MSDGNLLSSQIVVSALLLTPCGGRDCSKTRPVYGRNDVMSSKRNSKLPLSTCHMASTGRPASSITRTLLVVHIVPCNVLLLHKACPTICSVMVGSCLHVGWVNMNRNNAFLGTSMSSSWCEANMEPCYGSLNGGQNRGWYVVLPQSRN
ncbi:hypothetical protein BO99DRAFT_19541 [Aspergillus violaceofuscus CBS 115571]|uniref:Secreted protein n=1 Tax=Aspergillus violaceofuscus (strain CBS 115571) TaxID=1450538 RepID=A0A2V5IE97_ASPV1|nr:hypothetical protein BO99DRAFT_19541 [Aspergillus violaceofuscus CBS 115571]